MCYSESAEQSGWRDERDENRMTEKLDYKKKYKDLYLPSRKPMLIDVSPISFIQVDGSGEPGGTAY